MEKNFSEKFLFAYQKDRRMSEIVIRSKLSAEHDKHNVLASLMIRRGEDVNHPIAV
jgi:hypothetical protein